MLGLGNLFRNGGFLGGPRFSCDLRSYPVSFIDRQDLEAGNRLVLPPSALDRLTKLGAPSPMLFEISDLEGRLRTHGGVLEFVAPEETCYLPFWMLKQLGAEEGDVLHVSLQSLPKASLVRLRPASVALLRVYNPRALLESGLRNFVALTEGDSFAVEYDGKMYGLEVLETKPASAVCIVDADVSVEFATPKDAEAAVAAMSGGHAEAAAETDADVSAETRSAEAPKLFGGVGLRTDGLPAASPEADNADVEDDMPWKRRIPKGVKWTSPPFGVVVTVAKRPLSPTPLEPALASTGPADPDAERRKVFALEAAERREAADAEAIAERRRLEEVEQARRHAEEAKAEAARLAALEARRRRSADVASAAAAAAAAKTATAPQQLRMGEPTRGGAATELSPRGSAGCCSCFRAARPRAPNKV